MIMDIIDVIMVGGTVRTILTNVGNMRVGVFIPVIILEGPFIILILSQHMVEAK